MPTISAIKPSARDPLRCVIKVGREVVARLSRDNVDRLGLKVGTEWQEPLVSQVLTAGLEEAARHDAMKVIRRRMIGSRELLERLRRKGHGEPAAQAAIQDLTRNHLLDDERYGRVVVESELARKPAGKRLLQQKLYRKRLPRELIDKVVNQAAGKTDMVAEARRLAERKLRSAALQRCDPIARKRRLWGLLARRGFDIDTIEAALRGLTEPQA